MVFISCAFCSTAAAAVAAVIKCNLTASGTGRQEEWKGTGCAGGLGGEANEQIMKTFAKIKHRTKLFQVDNDSVTPLGVTKLAHALGEFVTHATPDAMIPYAQFEELGVATNT